MNASFTNLWPRFAPLVLIIAAAFAYVGQLKFDTWLFYDTPAIHTTYNEYIEPVPLSGASAKAASLGATNFLADVYWLETIQYYGGGDPYGKYRQLPALFNTITDLSPKFAAAYQNGLLILPSEKFVKEALALGEKGQKNIPDSWEIPYYEGLVYHINKKDYTAAAHQFDIAATKKGALPITKYFAGLYYKEAGSRQTAYQIFQTVYQTTRDSFVKERAKKQIGHLDGLFALQDAINAFQQKFHRHPKNLEELVTQKLIASIPVSPLGVHYTYDEATAEVGDAK